MYTKILLFLALALCAHASEVKAKENVTKPEQNKDKRQTQDEFVPSHFIYRNSRKQEQVAPVEEPQDDDREPQSSSRADEEYRPGQVFSLNPHELLELQPERKAPVSSSQQLQQLYNNPQPEHRENLQQIIYLEPQGSRQVSLQPSHAVIARPHYSSNGGEASVGAALSVSDSGVSQSDSYDQELLTLLGQAGVRQEERPQAYQTQQVQASTQTVAPQYQQIDRYITKPSKKPTKQRPKVHSHISPPQASAAPQQYLIETTNVQQQQPQIQIQYRANPPQQPQRAPQALRYAPVPSTQTFVQQPLYERPETQGLKVVAPPKLQQPRPQIAYRVVAQYQQPEASPKQYRLIEPRPQTLSLRQEQPRVPASSIERPVAYLKRYPIDNEKMRSVKIYDPVQQDNLPQQPAQIIGEQYYIRPLYRANEQPRSRYEITPLAIRPGDQQHAVESTKTPHSSIYVSKNLVSKKIVRPQALREQSVRIEQPSNVEQVDANGQSIEEQRSQLPPPRNNRAYTPEEFAALVAAGYSVTPIPVAPVGPVAQSRSSVEPAPAIAPSHPNRRPLYTRRHQYLPLRGDDAP